MKRRRRSARLAGMRCLAFFAFAVALAAQDAPAVALTAAEKAFQESLTNVQLVGYFTTGDSDKLSADKYTIERISKVKEDIWRFEARVQYNGKDFKLALPVPVKWAGDTPVISVTKFAIPGYGVFDARVVVYGKDYAGTWSGGAAGGKMFGKIVKLDAPPSDSAK